MPAKIMIVEDDINLGEIYSARLQAEGFQIISAKDGEEALTLALNEHPDLIMLDVMMPKISGFEMLDILRGTVGIQDVKVIMMTALSQLEDKTKAQKLGANRYLVKSQVTLEDVVKTVHEVLGDNQTSDVPEPAAVESIITPTVAEPITNPEPAAVEQTTPITPMVNPVAESLTSPDSVLIEDQTTPAENETVKSQIKAFEDSEPAADNTVATAHEEPDMNVASPTIPTEVVSQETTPAENVTTPIDSPAPEK